MECLEPGPPLVNVHEIAKLVFFGFCRLIILPLPLLFHALGCTKSKQDRCVCSLVAKSLDYTVFATTIITRSGADYIILFLPIRKSSLCSFCPLYSIKDKQTGIKTFMDTNEPKIVCN